MLSNSIKQLSIERNACALAVGGEPLPNTCGMSKTTCIENLIYFKESELGDDFSRPLERHDKRVRHRGSIAGRAETGIVTGNTCHVSRREGRQVEKRTLRNYAVRERVRRLTNSGRNVRDHDGKSTHAFSYSAIAQGSLLDLPTLSPANVARVSGNYTG